MNKYISIAKEILPALTNAGAGGLAAGAAASFIPRNLGRVTKILYTLGAVGIGFAVGNAAEKAMRDTIDKLLDDFDVMKKRKVDEVEIEVEI